VLVVGQQRAEHVGIARGIQHTHTIGEIDPQAHLVDLALDHRVPTEQDRPRDAVIDQSLRGTQHPLILTLAIHNAA
jgi:hypothetical protein